MDDFEAIFGVFIAIIWIVIRVAGSKAAKQKREDERREILRREYESQHEGNGQPTPVQTNNRTIVTVSRPGQPTITRTVNGGTIGSTMDEAFETLMKEPPKPSQTTTVKTTTYVSPEGGAIPHTPSVHTQVEHGAQEDCDSHVKKPTPPRYSKPDEYDTAKHGTQSKRTQHEVRGAVGDISADGSKKSNAGAKSAAKSMGAAESAAGRSTHSAVSDANAKGKARAEAAKPQLAFDKNAVLTAVLYSEILGKPKGLRR